jgi:hypothetical protein
VTSILHPLQLITIRVASKDEAFLMKFAKQLVVDMNMLFFKRNAEAVFYPVI